MIKFLRRKPFVNRLIRKVLEKTSYTLKNKIVSRWRIAGETFATIDGVRIKMFSDCDDGIVDALYHNSYFEIEELKLFGRLAERSHSILDIGANTGFYSVIASARNPKAEILAFEPYKSNADRLRRNLSINGANNVSVIEKAVGNFSGKIKISVPESGQICDCVSADSEFSNRFYKDTITYKEIEVEQTSIDELGIKSHIDLIKIDVENCELPVFEGAKKILETMSPIIQCEMLVDNERIEFYRNYLKPLGYNSYMMLKNGLLFCEELEPNPEGRDFLFTKQKLSKTYISFSDETLPDQLLNRK